MISRTIAVGVLAAGCVSAAAGGAYVAVRQNAATTEQRPAASQPETALAPGKPVSETEAVVSPQPQAVATERAVALRPEPVEQPAIAPRRPVQPSRSTRPARREAPRTVAPAPSTPAPIPDPQPVPSAPAPAVEPPRPELPPAPPVPQFEEVVVPSSSVIGLQVETSISSERARIEDRVNARVTRDVLTDGRVVIPAGTRAIGSVTSVDRGGKIKERARLGIRFHTLVLADSTELPIRTEAVFREGDAPSGESARKIGGAAIGGAILGAILGGGKGAAVGGAAGAAGGTAAVMAAGRNAATLSAGTVVTVRLTAPISVQVEKQ